MQSADAQSFSHVIKKQWLSENGNGGLASTVSAVPSTFSLSSLTFSILFCSLAFSSCHCFPSALFALCFPSAIVHLLSELLQSELPRSSLALDALEVSAHSVPHCQVIYVSFLLS